MITRERIEEAAMWRARLQDDPGVELSPAFVAWSADTLNVQALDKLDATWRAVDDTTASPEMMRLRRAALADAQRTMGRRWRPLSAPLRALAAAVLVAVALGAAAYTYLRAPDVYTTAVGERRVVTLGDGSRLSLDSASQVRVRYSTDARTLTLEKGRARFDVAHDTARPFMVVAGAETVMAVGTSFNVERLGSKVLVTLLEGKVVVNPTAAAAPDTAARPAISLSAGQQLVAAQATPPAVSAANLQVATAWENGRLAFYDEPLSEAVARVNRYAAAPIVVDPAVADVRISGVFNAGNVTSFLEAVTTYFPVEASSAQGQVRLRPRS